MLNLRRSLPETSVSRTTILGEGGAKQKYARNIEAIRTLFKLEQEHRGATAEEQQVLSQYVAGAVWRMPLTPAKIVGQRNMQS